MSQEREDKFIAAALQGLLAGVAEAYKGQFNMDSIMSAVDMSIYVGKQVAKRTEPFQPKEYKKEFRV